MLDYNVKIIKGFRVPFDKLFRFKKNEKNLCEHKYDREKNKYCPECGEPNTTEWEEERIILVDLDFEKLNDREDKFGNLIFCQQMSNCEIKGDDRDYVIGKELLSEDPNSSDNYIHLLKEVDKIEVENELNKMKVKIPYDENSFGTYVIFSIW